MYESDSAPPQRLGARCAQHVDSPATTICSRCGSYACSLCRTETPDGQEYCERCASKVSHELAEPGTRLIAHMVDGVANGLPFIAMMVLGFILDASMGSESGMYLLASMGLGVLGSLAVLGYQLYLLSTLGQTLGKRMMGIQVRRTDGSPVDLGRLIFLRNVVPWFINSACGIFFLVDALFIFGDERRCLHDQIADTIVVKVDVDGYPG
jgi:uncharacterized RDD family membrane protein YckC